MNGFVTLLVTALYALLLQNLVFTGGFGASEAVRISSKPRYVLSFALFITVFSAATSIICRALELLPQVSLAHTLVRLLIYMIVLFVLYVIVVLVFRYALHASDSILRKIGMAAFNTLVLAIPVINRSAAYTVGESLGAGAAFALAVFLIHAGIHVLDRNDKIPKAFQGTPALFIYVSLLALAFTGFSGRSLFI
jgi:electron transport complex protein RnfA